MTGTASRPVSILISALGGEGGGVLAGWIADAAVVAGLHVQRTSIPGVAQRTGATTYYLEILPGTDRTPVLALNPAPGRVDVLVGTELLETARMVQAGYATPDRTLLIGVRRRVFTVAEKQAMGDGRLDPGRLEEIARQFSRRAMIGDLEAVARASGGHLNAVLLGALAGSGAVPIPADAYREAVRAGGKAVEQNLRGFEAGLAFARDGAPDAVMPETGAPESSPFSAPDNPPVPESWSLHPPEAVPMIEAGSQRLAAYQDDAYVALYAERLGRFAGRPGVDGAFLSELARLLAVRMAFEDVIRVAQLKLASARLEAVRAESKARAGDIVDVVEYMKPGPEELVSLLPAGLARRVLAALERRGWSGWSIPMNVTATRFGGFLRLKLLASLRGWRPRTLRYAEEQQWIERWLSLVDRALEIDPAAAREVVALAGLVKGYSDTDRRGRRNFGTIATRIVEPALAGDLPPGLFADAVLNARLAALKDPEGAALGQTIEALWASVGPDRQAAE
ncbi:indolepyruvate oxidoreductase subunit beta family protein [Microbaculum marinum]|uniref:Indolepyruvate oxidoreductase subunit beta family protein n=1 Tax=Microbaculum marinum TaxID=1764581 RepID=A0AAW9RYW3_9HYPH